MGEQRTLLRTMFVDGTLFVMRKLLVEVIGGLEAPAHEVAKLVRADLASATSGSGYAPTVSAEGARLTYAIQGGWWYRGEWLVEPDGAGRTRYVHRVFNVADRLRWAVPLANRMFVGLRESSRRALEEQLVRLGERLGCRTWLQP
jgi:hypothetical protein